jgi:hypothetical protein
MSIPSLIQKHGLPKVVSQLTPDNNGKPQLSYYKPDRDTWAMDLLTPAGSLSSKRIELKPCVFHSGQSSQIRQMEAYNNAYNVALGAGKTPDQAHVQAKEAQTRASFYTDGAPDFGVWFENYECCDTCSYATQKNLKEQAAAREELKKFLDGCAQMIGPLDEMYKLFTNKLITLEELNRIIKLSETELRKKTQDINTADPTYMARKQLWDMAEVALETRQEAAVVSWNNQIKYQKLAAEQRWYQMCNDILSAEKTKALDALTAITPKPSEEEIQNTISAVTRTIEYPPFIFNGDTPAAKQGYELRYTADEAANVKKRKADFENWVNKNTYNPVEVGELKEAYKKRQMEREVEMGEVSRLAVDVYVRARYLIDQMVEPSAKLKLNYGDNKGGNYNDSITVNDTKLIDYTREMLEYMINVNVETCYARFKTNEASAYRRLIEQRMGGTHVVRDVVAPATTRTVIMEDGSIVREIVVLTEAELTVGNRVEIAKTTYDPLKDMAKSQLNEQYDEDDDDYLDRFDGAGYDAMGPDSRLGMSTKTEKKVAKMKQFKSKGPQRPQVKIKRKNHR